LARLIELGGERVTGEALPRIDLHRHLDGGLRLETVLDLARRHGVALPADDLEGLRPHLQILTPGPDLPSFLRKVELMVSVLGDYDACRRVGFENVEDAVAEGLHYVELRFSPAFMARSHGLNPEGVVEAVADGVEAARQKLGLEARLIGILSRTFGPEVATVELEALLAHRDRITALDLAGDEALWPGAEFVSHFRRGRDAGWHITVHAGEAAGPESVWQAIRELGAERIGHGVRATEDPRLLDEMLERGIGIESCLTSNLQTNTVRSLESHPLGEFLTKGLLATINTDDPTVSGIDLAYELGQAAGAAGLTKDQVAQARRNALATAFLSVDERKSLSERIGTLPA
jgi:adenosine deaminase